MSTGKFEIQISHTAMLPKNLSGEDLKAIVFEALGNLSESEGFAVLEDRYGEFLIDRLMDYQKSKDEEPTS